MRDPEHQCVQCGVIWQEPLAAGDDKISATVRWG